MNRKVLEKNKDVMPEELKRFLPLRCEVDHKTELKLGAKLLVYSPYHIALPKLEELKKQLKELPKVGHIRSSKAPYGVVVLFLKKEDGSLCLCVNYQALKKVTIKNKCPIPLVIDLFHCLR